jgi:hypothetical protein
MGQPVVHFEIGCRDSAKSAAIFATDPDRNTIGLWKPK